MPQSTGGPKYAYRLRVRVLILGPDANTSLTEEACLETKARVEGDAVDLVWLVGALVYARARGQSKVVDYLQTIADDMVFEAEVAARRSSLLSRVQ